MPSQKAPIWQAVDKLTERLVALELKLDTPSVPNAVVMPPVMPPVMTNGAVPVLEDSFPKYPTPPDFVDTVDIILNKSFGIRCEPLKDSPAFKFTITVPEKYSPMTPAQKEMLHADTRSKVITYADGVNAVRLQAERVFNSFDKDTQFRIVEDRPFCQRAI